MITKSPRKKSWFSLLLIAVAAGLWAYHSFQPLENLPQAIPPQAQANEPNSQQSTRPESSGSYEIYRGCTLAEARNNDGDSFMVHLPDGRKAEFRLYFVDTPESAFKRYAGGDTNYQRIRQQAADMGGITSEQAVDIGKKAKAFTLDRLQSRPFDIYTRWDSPFKDNRFHAFVKIQQDGELRWLEELLIERGLARIKTKPADLPDGTSASRHLQHLKNLERTAKRAHVGVWSL